jgi:hypothetical protein
MRPWSWSWTRESVVELRDPAWYERLMLAVARRRGPIETNTCSIARPVGARAKAQNGPKGSRRMDVHAAEMRMMELMKMMQNEKRIDC